MLPRYFSSEWSVAQFHLNEGLQYIVAFGHQKNTIVILGMDGRYIDKTPVTFPLFVFTNLSSLGGGRWLLMNLSGLMDYHTTY